MPSFYTIFRLFSVDYSVISSFWNPKTTIFMVYDRKNIESVAFTFAFDLSLYYNSICYNINIIFYHLF